MITHFCHKLLSVRKSQLAFIILDSYVSISPENFKIEAKSYYKSFWEQLPSLLFVWHMI